MVVVLLFETTTNERKDGPERNATTCQREVTCFLRGCGVSCGSIATPNCVLDPMPFEEKVVLTFITTEAISDHIERHGATPITRRST